MFSGQSSKQYVLSSSSLLIRIFSIFSMAMIQTKRIKQFKVFSWRWLPWGRQSPSRCIRFRERLSEVKGRSRSQPGWKVEIRVNFFNGPIPGSFCSIFVFTSIFLYIKKVDLSRAQTWIVRVQGECQNQSLSVWTNKYLPRYCLKKNYSTNKMYCFFLKHTGSYLLPSNRFRIIVP